LRWDRWIAYLAVALDLEEIADYKAYVYAQGDPKKFPWSSSDHAGTRKARNLAEEIITGFSNKDIGQHRPGDVWKYGEKAGWKSVTKANKWEQQPDGQYKMTGEVWVDENGDEVDTTGFHVVESQSGEAKAFARSVAEKLH